MLCTAARGLTARSPDAIGVELWGVQVESTCGLAHRRAGRGDAAGTAIAVLVWGARPMLQGYLYTIWTLAHAVLLFALPAGRGVLIVLIAGCGLADVGAYCVGKAVGRRRIAPRISPHKAWEGLLGDLLGAAVAVLLFRFALPSLSEAALAGLIVLIALGSAWGDLLSSLGKRTASVKDWGTLIPGHGGLLDRLNSLIVVMPLAYYYLRLLQGTVN